MSGLNSEEPPSQIYCPGLEDMKVRMTLSRGSQDCSWREDLGITMMINNNKINNIDTIYR